MSTSRVLVCGAILGPFVGLAGCGYELSEWTPPTADVTVTVPDTKDDETSSEPSPGVTDTSESPTSQSSDTDADTSMSTSSSDVSSSGTVDPCDNDALDDGETAIDCGGDDCQPCGLGLPCLENSDCDSQVCSTTCLAAGCDNGEVDGDETDMDCGGDGCDPCEDQAHCSVDSDCTSGVCGGDGGETCQVPNCSDEVRNGDEPGVDCGGTEDGCPLCPNGASCTEDQQCAEGACIEGVCAAPGCGDGRKNGTETDVDCGGDDCLPCKVGDICVDADDCESRVCYALSATMTRCAGASCEDGVKNGDEGASDCGGTEEGCPRCADGLGCNVATDCLSSVCSGEDEALACVPPACDDEVRNGTESGIDCGGDDVECARCDDGGPCGADSDCASNSCDGTTCQEASCSDGRQNPNESDQDCGGTCDTGCGFNGECTVDGDCLSNDCSTTCQKGVVGADCGDADDCLSKVCTNDKCVAGFRGADCMTGADCQSGYCKSDGTCGSGGLGAACQAAADCSSNLCSTTCQASRFSIKSDGGNDAAVVNTRFQIQANAADPARAWQDLAVMYFFTVVSPETHVNYLSRYYAGPNQATSDARFLAINQGSDWTAIWRASAGNIVNVPSAQATSVELQVRDNPWSTFNFANDYSYRTGGFAENTKMVVCQRVDGRWAHTQGTPPSSFANPCSFVVDTCAQSAATCDTLDRADN